MREAAYVLHPIRRALNVEELVTIHYFEYDKNYQYHGESHDFWELLYADRGTIISTCDEKELLLSGGEMILLPPNCFHTLRADKSKPSNVFIISFTERSGVLDAIAGRSLRLSAAMRELIRAIIREGEAAFSLPMDRLGVQVLHEREAAPLGAQQLIKMRLEELLILLLRGQAEPCAAAEARYDDDIAGRVQALLREHLYDRLTLSDITGELGYGKTYLSAVFKRVYGRSIMESYTHFKLDEAKYLLREGTMSVSEISDTLGFSSPQYFSKRFSALMNMSPRQYAISVREDWSTEAEED